MDEINIGGDESAPWQQVLTQSAHDLGSPLSAMRVLLELLRLNGDSAESRDELIELLESQVTDLVERIDALLKNLPSSDDDGSK